MNPGGDVMEAKPNLWEIPRGRKPFPCFIRDCKKKAEHLMKFMHGDALVQVCLCGDCLQKSPESILRGLRIQPRNTFN
jgi:hypothetical protein